MDYNRGEWTNDWSALFRVCYKRDERVSNSNVFSPITINRENFPNGLDLWVSSAILSKATGRTVFWASIDQFKNGALLYLSHTVYDGLSEVNKETVLPRLMTGEYEITEAKDIKTGELLFTTGDPDKGIMPEQVYMVSKGRKTLHADWECTQEPSSEPSNDDLPF